MHVIFVIDQGANTTAKGVDICKQYASMLVRNYSYTQSVSMHVVLRLDYGISTVTVKGRHAFM